MSVPFSPSSTSSGSYNADVLVNRFDLSYSPTPDPHARDSPHWSSRATEGGMSRREGAHRTDNTGPGRAIWDSLRQNNHSLNESDGADNATEDSPAEDWSSTEPSNLAGDVDWDEQGSDTTVNPHHMGNILSHRDHQQPNSNTSGETIDLTGSPSPAPASPRAPMPATRSGVQSSSGSRKRTRSEANFSTTDSDSARQGRSNKRQRRTATATANDPSQPLPGAEPSSDSPPHPGPRRRRYQARRSDLDSSSTEPDNGPTIHPSHLRTRIRPAAASRTNPPPDPPRTIEQIDLCDDDAAENDRRLLERQRADQIASQSQSTSVAHETNTTTNTNTASINPTTSTSTTATTTTTPRPHPTKLTTLTCTVCLDPPTDLTTTACGHLFCRSCLLDWLVSASREANRRPNCPACRKSLVWMDGEGVVRGGGRKKSDVVGLRFLRGKGNGGRRVDGVGA